MYRQKQNNNGIKIIYKSEDPLDDFILPDADEAVNKTDLIIDNYISKLNAFQSIKPDYGNNIMVLNLSKNCLEVTRDTLNCFGTFLSALQGKISNHSYKNPVKPEFIDRINSVNTTTTKLLTITEKYLTKYNLYQNTNTGSLEGIVTEKPFNHWQTLYETHLKATIINKNTVTHFLTAIVKGVSKFIELISRLKEVIDKIIIYDELYLENKSCNSNNKKIFNAKNKNFLAKTKGYKNFLNLQLEKITSQPYYLLN